MHRAGLTQFNLRLGTLQGCSSAEGLLQSQHYLINLYEKEGKEYISKNTCHIHKIRFIYHSSDRCFTIKEKDKTTQTQLLERSKLNSQLSAFFVDDHHL